MRRSTSSALRTVSMFACILLSAVMAHAQYRASIQGAVTDPQGALVPGATVTLTNQETNQARTTATNDAGVYNFNSLAPSHYTLSVEKSGFKQKILKDLSVIAEQANAVNVALEVGESTESVTVTDATPPIDTETGNVSGTVTAQQIQTMPSFGRDVFQLLQLAPGAFGDGAQSRRRGNFQPARVVDGWQW